MTVKNSVITGRRNAARDYQEGAYCASCGIRRLIGEPKESHSWVGRLHNARLTEEQVDLILVAAAEFRNLSLEAGEAPDPIAFVDWLRPDALGRVSQNHPEADGAPARYESGGRANDPLRAHRHPDPIPVITRSSLGHVA